MRIEGNAPDPWSVLRRKYTGPWFFVHLILLIVFFLPYVGQVLYLSTYSQIQDKALQLSEHMVKKIEGVPYTHNVVQDAQQWVRDHHRKVRAWRVLVGWEKGLWAFGLTVLVVVYNLIRSYLTLQVSSLRDAEERSSTTPTLEDYYGLCHPLKKDGHTHWYSAVPVWWHSHKNRRWLAWPQWWPKWRTKWWPLRDSISTVPPHSFVECFGLVRLHKVASVIVVFVLFAVAFNVLMWVKDTWVWVQFQAPVT